MLINLSVTLGQTQKPGDDMDSVFVRGRSFLILGEKSMYIEKDTLLLLPDSVASQLKKDETRRSDEFYSKIKVSFYKHRFTKELYDLLFRDTSKKTKPRGPTVRPGNNYEEHAGKVISRVIIKKLEIFGASINDTTKRSNKWAIRAGNRLHVYTRGRVVRNNIFFTDGDRLDPDLIVDSERILRSLPFVRDSRIYVVPGATRDEVDVIILVKDLWSISFDGGASDLGDWDLTLTERNFLGLGHELRNEFDYDDINNPKVGYSGTYTINSIKNTFITADLNFVRSQNLDRTRLRIFRNFITPETKYAGGIQLTRQNELVQRIEEEGVTEFFSEFDNQDFWFGRSYMIDRKEDVRTNLQIATRFSRTNFVDRPMVSEDTNQLFFDNDLYLFSIGYSKRSYEKSSLIRGYGRTEDIPQGALYEITAGRDINEFNERTYVATRVIHGKYFGRFGYARPSLAVGGFLRDGRFEQGMLNLNVTYFSNLYRFKRVNFRQFFDLDYTHGLRRFDDEFITINDQLGVRGLSNVFLRGTRRFNFKSETVAFTPVFFWGFRMAIFTFLDFAIVNNRRTSLFDNKLYQGYGLGFRFRNENLAFNTLQIRLAWYPRTPANATSYDLDLTGRTSLQIGDFRVNEPEVLPFR